MFKKIIYETYENISFSKLGSYVIKDGDFSVIKNFEPNLPILSSGRQVTIPSASPDGTNYRLNITSTNLFQGEINAEGDVKLQNYFNAKAATNLSRDKSKKSQISIGAGMFINRLGEIFRDANRIQVDAEDFEPLYYLWLEYQIPGRISDRDSVIYTIDGMCIYSNTGIERVDEFVSKNEISSSGNFPFLSYDSNAQANWTKSNEVHIEERTYDVYLFSKPRCEPIPSVEKILSNWEVLSRNIPNAISLPNPEILPQKELIVEVSFGPIPNEKVLPLVRLDEKFSISMQKQDKFVNKIKLIPGSQTPIPGKKNYYKFKVAIWRDEAYLGSTHFNGRKLLRCNLPLRFYIDQQVNDKYLDKIYDNINLETQVYPYISSETNWLPYPKKDIINYKPTLQFFTGTNEQYSVENLTVYDVFGMSPLFENVFKQQILSAYFRARPGGLYEMYFPVNSNSDYLALAGGNSEVKIGFKFRINGDDYTRLLTVRIFAADLAKISQDVRYDDPSELYSELNLDALTPTGTKISDIQKLNDNNSGLRVNGFINSLIESKVIKQAGSSFIIDSKYLKQK